MEWGHFNSRCICALPTKTSPEKTAYLSSDSYDCHPSHLLGAALHLMHSWLTGTKWNHCCIKYQWHLCSPCCASWQKAFWSQFKQNSDGRRDELQHVPCSSGTCITAPAPASWRWSQWSWWWRSGWSGALSVPRSLCLQGTACRSWGRQNMFGFMLQRFLGSVIVSAPWRSVLIKRGAGHTCTVCIALTPPSGAADSLHFIPSCFPEYNLSDRRATLTVSVRHSGCRSWQTLWSPRQQPCRGSQERTAWWRAWRHISRSTLRPRPPRFPPRVEDEQQGAVRSAPVHCRRRHLHRHLPLWTGLWSLRPPAAVWWVQEPRWSLAGSLGVMKQIKLKRFHSNTDSN